MQFIIAAIIQARIGSTRHPAKVLRPLAGAPMIERLVERIRNIKRIDHIILAIPDNPGNLPLAEWAEKLNLNLVKGPEEDVLQRFLMAGDSVKADHILRITGDNPLIDPELADAILEDHLATQADYTHIGDSLPLGLSSEAVRLQSLKQIASMTHQTYFHDHPKDFQIHRVIPPRHLIGKTFRLTVDTPEDFTLMEKIYKEFYRPGRLVNLLEVIPFLESYPEICHLNSHILQKDWRKQN